MVVGGTKEEGRVPPREGRPKRDSGTRDRGEGEISIAAGGLACDRIVKSIWGTGGESWIVSLTGSFVLGGSPRVLCLW